MKVDWKWVVFVTGWAVVSCQHFPQDREVEKDPEEQESKEIKAPDAPVRVVGEVVSVHPEEGFVLIRSFGGGRLPQGVALSSVDHGGQSSLLKPTGERIGKYYAADVGGRLPAAGDLVLARKLPDSGIRTSPEGAPNPL